MIQYKFFHKIGAFSVNLENSKSLITSLRYAVNSMERPKASLFIFPEGEIVPFSTDKPKFKKGLIWIAEKCPDVDFVPIGIYIDTSKFDKPELFLMIGKPVMGKIDDYQNNPIELYEAKLQEVLISLQIESYRSENTFQKL